MFFLLIFPSWDKSLPMLISIMRHLQGFVKEKSQNCFIEAILKKIYSSVTKVKLKIIKMYEYISNVKKK